MIDPKNCSKAAAASPWTQFVNRNFTSSSSTTSTCQSIDETTPYDKSIQSMCDSMRRQIMCRAFSGWLSYTRHIKTVTTHLSQLVMPLTCIDESIYSEGLTPEKWLSLFDQTGAIPEASVKELFAYLYFGGCDGTIRKQVWPYLLKHYNFAMVPDERKKRDVEMQQLYEMLMTEWMAVEAIVKQRDKELTAANLAKLSSESNNSTEIPPPLEGRSASNDVFCEETTSATSINTSQQSDRPKSGRISRQKQLEDQVTEVKIDDDLDTSAPSPTCGGGVYSVCSELLPLLFHLAHILLTFHSHFTLPTFFIHLSLTWSRVLLLNFLSHEKFFFEFFKFHLLFRTLFNSIFSLLFRLSCLIYFPSTYIALKKMFSVVTETITFTLKKKIWKN